MLNPKIPADSREQHLKVYKALTAQRKRSSADIGKLAGLTAMQACRSLRYLSGHGFAAVEVEGGNKLYWKSDRAVKTDDDLFQIEKLRRVPVARQRRASRRVGQASGVSVLAGVTVRLHSRNVTLSFKEASELYDALGRALQ